MAKDKKILASNTINKTKSKAFGKNTVVDYDVKDDKGNLKQRVRIVYKSTVENKEERANVEAKLKKEKQ